MPATRPHLIISETTQDSPILIIDKNGELADALIEKLKHQFLIVLVSEKEIKSHANLIHIHYGKKIPSIPDEQYSIMITVFHGEKTTIDMLPSIAKKAIEINAKQIFITSLASFDNKLKKLLAQGRYEKTTQVIYGEIFGHVGFEHNLLTNYIHQVRSLKKIEITGNGLQKSYPILFEDVCDAIIAIAFTHPLKDKTILLIPKHGFTQLAIARAFQKLDPLIKISFKKQKYKETEYYFPQEAQYLFPSYDIEEKLRKIDLSIDHSKKKIKQIKPANRHSKKIHLPLLLFLCLLYFLLPLFLEFMLLLGGGFFLNESIKTAQDKNIPMAQKYNLVAKASFATSGFIGQNLSGINPVLLTQKEPLTQKAQVGISLSEINSDFLDTAIIVKSILEEKTTDPKNDFLLVIAKIKNNLVTLQKLKAEGRLPPVILEKVNSHEHALTLLGNTIDIYPELLGFNGKRKYLILFQNNMELRPGGGFIGSFATVDIQNGKTGKLEIHDVYDADGKLSAHIEPPFALRRYLGAPHLFLRDSNFDVDFTVNAGKAQNFLELETGEKVDGVIAIDTDFVKNLIAIFGPLHITDFKETVTADNFFLLTETHAEKDFFPGSTQKKDFLRAVYNALESKLTADQKIPFIPLVKNLSFALKQKHLLIAVPNTETQIVLTVNKLSGSLKDNREKEDNKFLDFLGINEANLGMNKTNFYINRSIIQKVNIDEKGSARETTTVAYENTSKKESPFGGDYKNYLRFILPESALLQSVEVNEVEIATTSAITQVNEFTKKGFIPPQQLEVEKTKQSGKTIYGFLTIIPMQSSQKISITYSLANVYNPAKPVFTYDLSLFKQAGTASDPYSFSIAYPKAYQVIHGASGFTDVGGKLLHTDKLSEDKNLNFKFSKK